MMTSLDVDLSPVLSQQRVAELRAEAERHRLAHTLRHARSPSGHWWRRVRAGLREPSPEPRKPGS